MVHIGARLERAHAPCSVFSSVIPPFKANSYPVRPAALSHASARPFSRARPLEIQTMTVPRRAWKVDISDGEAKSSIKKKLVAAGW